jgi:2-polyprenyl-3-methyl-5-hydroxy-6-metoxy-1,4-benzoquinol methylase
MFNSNNINMSHTEDTSLPTNTQSAIRSKPELLCVNCKAKGAELYSDLADSLFSAPGLWSFRRCTSPECGLLWLDPMPLKEDIHKAYKNYYTHAAYTKSDSFLQRLFDSAKQGYLANHFAYTEGVGLAVRLLGLLPWLYPGRPAELDFSVMWLKAGARGRLLDIGAGSGWLVDHMNRLGWQAEGLDFDTQTVTSARSRGLIFHQGGLVEQRFADASFDAITMSHCIEHFHDPLAWLIEAHRLLKPSGRLSLATPNTNSYWHQIFGKNWFALQPPCHLHLFNRASLTQLLQQAGFGRPKVFTSIRDANGSYLGSRAIKQFGRYDMLNVGGVSIKLQARIMQMLEGLAKQFDADAGEDIVALAIRS